MPLKARIWPSHDRYVYVLLLSVLSVLCSPWLVSPASASPISNIQYGIQLSNDLFLAPDVPYLSSGSKPDYYEASEYLIGKVAVGVISLESNGAIDSNTEDWTSDEEQRVISEVTSGLSWWASQNPSAKVAFSLEIHLRVPTKYEPISRPQTDEDLWISEAMAYLGYPGSPTDYFSQVRNYINIDLREKLDTDWAFAIFVVDSSRDIDGKFTDGYSAYAYLGGPFLVMTYDNDGWGIDRMDRVAAHEIGHIFYATDEYNGKTEYSGYLNVPDVEGSGALMDKSEWWLSTGTKGQIGWRDTDGDGILDIVDTFPKTTLTLMPSSLTDATTVTYKGTVEEIPYPNRNPWGTGRDVTINTIKVVRFRVDGGTWLSATSTDGSFDDVQEEFTIITPNLSTGLHTVDVYSVNSINNFETPFLRHTFIVTFIIIDQSLVSGTRVDVGSIQQVSFRAIWAHDFSPLSSGIVYVNGIAHITGPDGWMKISVSSSQVGKQAWSITGVKVGDITKYTQMAPNPTLIWDKLEIVSVSVNDTRMNIGSAFELRYKIRYDYDDVIFDDRKGSLLGFTWDSVNLWWKKTVTGSTLVTSTNYDENYLTINDAIYGLTVKQDVAGVNVITDRIKVESSGRLDGRADVGTSDTVCFILKYEYDGALVTDGSVLVNGTASTYNPVNQRWELSVTQSSIGKWSYRISAVSGNAYGINVINHVAPNPEVIFDRVQVTITTSQERVEVGTKAPLNWTGKYEYDGATFTGEVTLSEELVKSSIGRFNYTVKDVHDPQYGLKAFVSNTVDVIFDRIVTDLQTETLIPGSIKPIVRLRYQFDGAPVVDAKVVIDGVEATNLGDGSYITSISTWGPYMTYNLQIDRSGFITIQMSGSVFALGNIITIGSIVVVILTVVIIAAIKRRRG